MSTLNPEQWQILSPYLDQALALTGAERDLWLDSLRRENAALASQLEALLDEQRAAEREDFLQKGPTLLPTSQGLAGQTIGAYKLISLIGHGGMGSVWLAERSDGRFERRSALKFLNFALVGRGGEERFKREGTILGRLSHPNIAELVDAGVSSTGQPYLVLEYVDGEHIDQYCDRRQLDVEARIRLFLDVLLAVAHAHANLIVHRDLKPSNLLVRKDGQVKLLDFGISKLLEGEGESGEATSITVEGGRAMTPVYAAPEQVTGGAVTTATDIYALGALLYVLLTGQHPARADSRSPADLFKAIVETDPPRPSEVVASSRLEAVTANAAKRATTPDRLRRRLRGDLDTIVAKALKKNPHERYVSATALAEDLGRHLQHEPISARRDTIPYRAGRFLRRYRVPVAAAALVVASLSAGLYEANRERVIAQRRFDQLRQLSNRVFDLDQAIKGLPGSTEARERLVTTSLEYLERLGADAHGDLNLAREVAESYERVARIQGVPIEQNLGHFDKAEETLKKSEVLNESVLAVRKGDRGALYLSVLIAHDRMVLAASERRSEGALIHAQRVTERLNAFLSRGDATEAERDTAAMAYANVSLSYRGAHRYGDAVLYAQKAVEIARTLPASNARLSSGLAMLTMALRDQGELEPALEAIREARVIAERSSYRNETGRMIILHGTLLRQGLLLGEEGDVSLGRPADAVEPLQKALDITEDIARRSPNDYTSRGRLGATAGALGGILSRRDPQRALEVCDLGIRRLAEVPNNVTALRDRAELLAMSSYALSALHRDSEARRRIEDAFAIFKETKDYPAGSIRTESGVLTALRALADNQADQGDPRAAIETYRDLLEKVMASKPDPANDLHDACKLAGIYQSMADLYRRTGDTVKAEGMAAQERDLWHGWDRKLPNNAFVRRQIAAMGLP